MLISQYGSSVDKRGSITGELRSCHDRDGYSRLIHNVILGYQKEALRFARTYGSNTEVLLEGITDLAGMGENFGHNLYEAELRYLVKHEWVIELDDAIWRRTKLGMWLNNEQNNVLRNG